ncbi:MAG: hypothetical protein AAGH57_04640 [Pseudomonadota bacterium]
MQEWFDRNQALGIKPSQGPMNSPFRPTTVYVLLSQMVWALGIIAVLGIGNFAIHRAVLESGHPLVEQMPEFLAILGGRLTLFAEFAVLLAALMLAANGWPELAWAYLAYSVLNAIAAWLILRFGA